MSRKKKAPEGESYKAKLRRLYHEATTAGDAEAVIYYAQKMGTTSACADFATFKGSWAYTLWASRHKEKIAATKELMETTKAMNELRATSLAEQ